MKESDFCASAAQDELLDGLLLATAIADLPVDFLQLHRGLMDRVLVIEFSLNALAPKDIASHTMRTLIIGMVAPMAGASLAAMVVGQADFPWPKPEVYEWLPETPIA